MRQGRGLREKVIDSFLYSETSDRLRQRSGRSRVILSVRFLITPGQTIYNPRNNIYFVPGLSISLILHGKSSHVIVHSTFKSYRAVHSVASS